MGPRNARIGYVGEAPGRGEEKWKKCFAGEGGNEFNRYLRDFVKIDRKQSYTTNISKVRSSNPKELASAADVALWTPYLTHEISLLHNLDMIVTLGKYSTSWALGENCDMESYHGIPILLSAAQCKKCGIASEPTTVVNVKWNECDVYVGRRMPPKFADGSVWGNPFTVAEFGRQGAIDKYREWLPKQKHLMDRLPELQGKRLGCWCYPEPCHAGILAELADQVHRRVVCIPAYNPISGISQNTLIHRIVGDFENIGAWVAGDERSLIQDEYPNPDYRELTDSPEDIEFIRSTIRDAYYVALDTEESGAWGMSFSCQPGTGYCIRTHSRLALAAVDQGIRESDCFVVGHFMYDADLEPLRKLGIEIPFARYRDTILNAYHRGDHQGLKTLCWRHFNMDMQDYMGIVGPYREEYAAKYLQQIINEPERWRSEEEAEYSTYYEAIQGLTPADYEDVVPILDGAIAAQNGMIRYQAEQKRLQSIADEDENEDSADEIITITVGEISS